MAQVYYQKHEIDSVIVTEDKDLLQVPGLHYNKNKSPNVFRISETQGFKNLWTQVITGDKTDNIPGVSHAATLTTTGRWNREIQQSDLETSEKLKKYRTIPAQEKFGPATAEKYLNEYPLDLWPSKVLELYIDKYEDSEDDKGFGDLRFYETFDLIYMIREPPEGLEITFNFHPAPAQDGVEDMFEEF